MSRMILKPHSGDGRRLYTGKKYVNTPELITIKEMTRWKGRK